VRKDLLIGVIAALWLAGCGGGGGDSTVGSSSGSSGGSSSGGNPTNVVTVTVDGGPAQVQDSLFTTVTVCVPGSTTQCQTIDHIQVDTGSFGLRIIGAVLNNTLNLPQQNAANGNPVAECVIWGDGYSWGPIKMADMTIGGEKASDIPVQVIGDSSYSAVPGDCVSAAPPNMNGEEDSVQTFGANGIIGVGPFVDDCGSYCADTTKQQAANYYNCANNTCTDATEPEADQVSNPVAFFGTDSNGVMIQLPAVANSVATTLTGSMYFGIGTQSNNGLGSARIYTGDPNAGYFITAFPVGGMMYADSFLDTGSNAYYFVDTGMNVCASSGPNKDPVAPGFFCPASPTSLSATIQGQNGIMSPPIDFTIDNAHNDFSASPNAFVFANIGIPNSDPNGFDWGLPFFFGRTVFTAIAGKTAPGGTAPYFAF